MLSTCARGYYVLLRLCVSGNLQGAQKTEYVCTLHANIQQVYRFLTIVFF